MDDKDNTGRTAVVIACVLITIVVVCCCVCLPLYRYIFPDGPFA